MAAGLRTYPHTHWRQSLVFRTILLGGVLLVCLLASVFLLTNNLYRRALEEMEDRVADIAQDIEVRYKSEPLPDLGELAERYADETTDVELAEVGREAPTQLVYLARGPSGNVTRIARSSVILGDRRILITTTARLSPQTEVLRAFRDRYFLGLTVIFVITLVMMIVFVFRTLRPLGELSEACTRISAGELKPLAMRRSSGEVRTLEYTFNHMVASLREKEVMEANLRQAQRLSAIGNLAAGVAHDVRNPLNAIKLLASHANDSLPDNPDTARARRQIDTIRNEVHRLEDIVSGFLSLAKERELAPEPSRVDELVAECVRLVHQDAKGRDVQLQTELRACDAELMLDPKQWTRAVLNVLLNALDACPEGGRVRVYTRCTEFACEVEVRDDGPGMTRDQIEHAFDPYFTTKPTGTGLGLSITRGIIEEHGGHIEITSTPGQGCQVLISMPKNADESTAVS